MFRDEQKKKKKKKLVKRKVNIEHVEAKSHMWRKDTKLNKEKDWISIGQPDKKVAPVDISIDIK